MAQVLVQLNQREEALAMLEKYFREKKTAGDWMPVGLRFHPVWDPLRDDPRLKAMFKVPETRK